MTNANSLSPMTDHTDSAERTKPMDPTASNTPSLLPTASPLIIEALEMLKNGSTLLDIKAATGLQPAKVSLYATAHSIRRGLPSNLREAIDLVDSGQMTVAEAAEWTATSKYKIYYAMRKRVPVVNGRRRIPRNANITKWREIAAMRSSGSSLGTIAKAYGVSRQRIHQLLAKGASYASEAATQEGVKA